MRRALPRGESGAGTVLALSLFGVVLVVGIGAGGAVGIVATHRTAQSAADLAALAGAAAVQDGDDACGRAAEIAARNGAVVRGCVVEGWEVAVTAVATTVPVLGSLDLPARARAGPASGLDP